MYYQLQIRKEWYISRDTECTKGDVTQQANGMEEYITGTWYLKADIGATMVLGFYVEFYSDLPIHFIVSWRCRYIRELIYLHQKTDISAPEIQCRHIDYYRELVFSCFHRHLSVHGGGGGNIRSWDRSLDIVHLGKVRQSTHSRFSLKILLNRYESANSFLRSF